MTLLNTISNLGGTWPKYFVLEGVEKFTTKECLGGADKVDFAVFRIGDKLDLERCATLGGRAHIVTDGYYVMNTLCIIVGVLSFWSFIQPKVKHLQSLPNRSWRVSR